MATNEILTKKKEQRKSQIALRSAIDASRRAAGADAVARRVAALLRAHPECRIVSGFLKIGDEIDPQPSLDAALALGCRLCLPVMVGKGQPLIFRAWTPGDELLEKQWGIREPGPSAEPLDPDVLLVPMLSFDVRGGRLGYGGGFFDRTIAAARARRSLMAVGVCFDEQRVDSVPRLDYDERLDWVLTPSATIDCRTAG